MNSIIIIYLLISGLAKASIVNDNGSMEWTEHDNMYFNDDHELTIDQDELDVSTWHWFVFNIHINDQVYTPQLAFFSHNFMFFTI